MGVSFYPRVEGESEGWTRQISGKALARDYQRLHKLIKRQGYPELISFYVPHPEEMTESDKEEWFKPNEGIVIFEAMAEALEERRTEFQSYERLKEDLQDFRSILDRAAAARKRWNLAIDI
jgi:hypothetical protein